MKRINRCLLQQPINRCFLQPRGLWKAFGSRPTRGGGEGVFSPSAFCAAAVAVAVSAASATSLSENGVSVRSLRSRGGGTKVDVRALENKENEKKLIKRGRNDGDII